jgi:hypothetical protein
MKNTLAAAIIVALGATSTSAFADTRINGFASIVAGTTSDEDKSLFGYDDTLSFKPESKFALQVTSDLGEGLSATAQIMSRGANDFSSEFEWAYISYEINENSQINLGKLRIPFYRYSDFLDVGYAYNWIRPPSTVYSLSFSTYEGASYVYNSSIGMVDSSVQVLYGAYRGDVTVITPNDKAAIDGITGVNWTLTYDWLTARIAYLAAETSIDTSANEGLTALKTNLSGFGLTNVADDLTISEDDGTFFGVGFSIDYNNFIVDAEMTSIEVADSLIADQSQAYVTLGYRIDQWTFLTTVESRTDEFDSSRYGQAPGALGAAVDGTLKSLEFERDIFSVGARYNFHPSAALKFDYTTREDEGEDSINVLSVGVDLVF